MFAPEERYYGSRLAENRLLSPEENQPAHPSQVTYAKYRLKRVSSLIAYIKVICKFLGK